MRADIFCRELNLRGVKCVLVVVGVVQVSEERPEMSQRGKGAPDDSPDFTMFCQSEYPVLIGLLSLLVGDRWSAADLPQEALARSWIRWSRVGSLERPDLWTKRVAINLARSAWRRRQVADRADVTLLAGATAAVAAPAPAFPHELLDAARGLPP